MKYPYRVTLKAREGRKLEQLKALANFRSNQCRGDTMLYTLSKRRTPDSWRDDSPTAAFELCFSDKGDAVMFKLSWSEEILEDG